MTSMSCLLLVMPALFSTLRVSAAALTASGFPCMHIEGQKAAAGAPYPYIQITATEKNSRFDQSGPDRTSIKVWL